MMLNRYLSGLFGYFWVIQVYAQTKPPFGVPTPQLSATPETSSVFVHFLLAQQANFHAMLIAALNAMKTDPYALFWLMFIAFAYGVLHAIGPGHGKAVVASYILANEEGVKRALALAFAAALVQACAALLLVGVVAGLWGGRAQDLTHSTHWIEQIGSVLLMILGLWIVLRKILAFWNEDTEGDCCACGVDHNHKEGRFAFVLAAIGAGIRPCSGALILLVFALSQGLFLAGVLSTLVMGIGTAIGTSIFAFLTIKIKRFATTKLQNRVSFWGKMRLLIEILLGFVIFIIGFLMLRGEMGAGG